MKHVVDRVLLVAAILSFAQMATASDQNELLNILRKEGSKCLSQIAESSPPDPNKTYCPPEWDLVTCWPYGEPGEKVDLLCPEYLPDFNNEGHVFRFCDVTGKWVVNPATNKTYANYTECLEDKQAERIPREVLKRVTTMYTIGYSVSLGSLFIAFIILASFKRLHCTRNYVHMHLFMSYMLRAFFILVKDAVLVGVSASVDTPRGTPGCKVVQTIFMYFMATNYFWILVEGLYLHNLIFVSVFSERKFFYGFIAIGWVFPLTFVVPWVVVRATLEDNGCWDTDDLGYTWIYKAPIVAAILLNFLLFLNILRVLAKKMRSPASIADQNGSVQQCCGLCLSRQPEEPTRSGRRGSYGRRRSSIQLQMPMKLAKSTLVLIPLFGVHYIVFVGMPDNVGGTAYEVRLYFDLFFNSFQGFFVAILYCFLNGEVRAEFKRRWEHWKLKRSLNANGNNRGAFSFTSRTSMDYSYSVTTQPVSNGGPAARTNNNVSQNGSPTRNGLLQANGKCGDDVSTVPRNAQKRASFNVVVERISEERADEKDSLIKDGVLEMESSL
ncbi:parathyroid hormone/parathyroid hormone-related peptide receptor-like [Branchiostoma lanceolatum]|uniref:parathyroid hormone/parathyroid hormone-related peptide receptor-like n=1 Tax=Branchiostoma lanceolatum TaxID=7740 RepID=UPI003451D5EC